MKQTDLNRHDRNLRKARKKEEVLQRKISKTNVVGDYINELANLFYHDTKKIYNILISEEILELLESIKQDVPEEKWENILRKAIKKVGVTDKEEAYTQLNSLLY